MIQTSYIGNMTRKLYFAAIACALFAAPVSAQQQCGGLADFYSQLAENYGESVMWIGDLDNGGTVSLWGNSNTETWTILVANGEIACTIATGTGFASVPIGEPL